MTGYSIIRWLSEQPPDWPEAHLNLIDALRDYIRAEEALANDLLDEGSITREQYNEGMLSVVPMRMMLADLERHEIDPTLGGFKK